MRKAADPIRLDGRDVLGTVLEVLGWVDLLFIVLDLETSSLLLGRVGSILGGLKQRQQQQIIRQDGKVILQ